MYYQCKRERDAQLFTSIKKWEIGHVQKLDDKKGYVKELEQARESLVAKFEGTPSSIANKHKRWRMAADIEQLQWRSTYLKDPTNPQNMD